MSQYSTHDTQNCPCFRELYNTTPSIHMVHRIKVDFWLHLSSLFLLHAFFWRLPLFLLLLFVYTFSVACCHRCRHRRLRHLRHNHITVHLPTIFQLTNVITRLFRNGPTIVLEQRLPSHTALDEWGIGTNAKRYRWFNSYLQSWHFGIRGIFRVQTRYLRNRFFSSCICPKKKTNSGET